MPTYPVVRLVRGPAGGAIERGLAEKFLNPLACGFPSTPPRCKDALMAHHITTFTKGGTHTVEFAHPFLSKNRSVSSLMEKVAMMVRAQSSYPHSANTSYEDEEPGYGTTSKVVNATLFVRQCGQSALNCLPSYSC